MFAATCAYCFIWSDTALSQNSYTPVDIGTYKADGGSGPPSQAIAKNPAETVALVTAIIGLLTALFELIRTRHKFRTRMSKILLPLVPEDDRVLVNRLISGEDASRNLCRIVRSVIPGNSRIMIDALIRAAGARTPDEICSRCGALTNVLQSSGHQLPTDVFVNASKLVVPKCFHSDEQASEAAFQSLGAMAGYFDDIEQVSNAFKPFMNTKLTWLRRAVRRIPLLGPTLLRLRSPASHVRRFATIHFLALFQQHCEGLRLEIGKPYPACVETLIKTFEFLETLADSFESDPQDREMALSLIANLRFLRNRQILNLVLPQAVDLATGSPKELADSFLVMVEALDAFLVDDHVYGYLIRQVEEWLNLDPERCPPTIKMRSVIRIHSCLQSKRGTAQSMRPGQKEDVRTAHRFDMHRRQIELLSLRTGSVLRGELVNASEGGFCLEVEGELQGDDFQKRATGAKGFPVQDESMNEIGTAQLAVVADEKSAIKVSVDVETLRAWKVKGTTSDTTRKTGLAGIVTKSDEQWRKLMAQG
jgi:hypothetical protein